MLKNGAASVISSSETVGGGGAFIRGGRLNKGAFINNFYLLGGAFIQSITVSQFLSGDDALHTKKGSFTLIF